MSKLSLVDLDKEHYRPALKKTFVTQKALPKVNPRIYRICRRQIKMLVNASIRAFQ